MLAHTSASLLCVAALTLSALASPLYLSVPSRYILKADDFKNSAVDSPFDRAPPSANDAGHKALEIMLQGRALRDEDENERPVPNPFRPMHIGNRTITMGPGPAMINRTRPVPIISPGGRFGEGRDGAGRSGSSGSAEGGTVTNNGTDVSNSGGAGRPGLPGTSTAGSAVAGDSDLDM
ncbi:hypothetical protein PsYK624_074470 [Phanerochaete sordida]|uniref:Uncharacterized protein n=1 Tax=Phanerochaete sordida TaxID=48140 RepID=A0A9P3GAF8_9APHY|nr:hypothetical protein PsYK624_074470 [Phanerochaete sordida]